MKHYILHFSVLILLLINLDSFAQSYPSISCTASNSYKIVRVNLEGIYEDSDTDDGSYTDYTDGQDNIDKALVVRGKTYTLHVKVKKGSKYKYTTAWIDWNDDGDFTDSGEEYILGTNTKTKNLSENITIPTNAAKGKIRMRIVTLKGNAPTSAGDQGNKGEAEDYALSVGDIGDFLYYTSDEADARYKIDKNTGYSAWLDDNNVDDIEAMAIWPIQGYTTYYAANGGDFGTLGLESGDFTLISDIDADGKANGVDGPLSLSDVDGLGFDARTGILWASNRRSGDYDVLFQINPSTGKYVKNAFGNNIDYLKIDGSGVYEDFDDIAVNPINGKMYGVDNDGSNAQLLEINPLTGAIVISTAISGAKDLEGLTFDNAGTLYSTSGDDNEMYTIDIPTGNATFVGEAWLWGGDVEAVIALVDEANKITGNLWKDDDDDGIKDAGETTGISGVTVELWYDANNNNEVDANDELLQSTKTDANGDYVFDYATTGNLAIQVKTSTLPSGYALTTDNKESADFSSFGNTETNNNFGADNGSDCDGDGIPDFKEGTADTDGDGVQNKCDLDSDNDGILDSVEGTKDTDGDGIPDYLDLDSDNDGIPDAIEANGGAAPADYNSSTGRIGGGDSDGDGLMNSIDAGSTSNLVNYDTDDDGVKDYIDLDSDNDGILDIVEAGGADANGDGVVDSFSDSNNDGYNDSYASSPLPIYNNDAATEAVFLPNYRDIDSDGDTIDDTREGYSPAKYKKISIVKDSDGDGILNQYDINSDGEAITPFDYDNDGVPDYQDQDSDNDGASDMIEGNDANGDGVVDSSPSGVDANKNGLDDTFDNNCVGTNSAGTTFSIAERLEENVNNGNTYDASSSSDIELTYENHPQIVGLRYEGINIAQGETITKAYIQFQVNEVKTGSIDLIIQAEDVNNSSALVEGSGNYDVSSRTTTTASVTWSPADWNNVGDAGSAQRTVDISSVIQEVVNRGGWSSGNAITIIISSDNNNTNKRTAENTPTLTITTASSSSSGLQYDCGSDIALNDINANNKKDFRDVDEVLPIVLIKFSAQLLSEHVEINWTTASEENNDYFVVQKSLDNINFEEIDRVKGAGNSNGIRNYKSYDYNPAEGVTYYRLKQVDYDGRYTFSQVVVVRNNPDNEVTIFPNPSNGEINIETKDGVEISIYSISGQQIANYRFEANTINKIDLTNQPKGIYLLAYITNDKRVIKKLIVR